MKSQNIFAKTHAKTSRKSLKPGTIDTEALYSSTGFNWKILPKTDKTLHAVSHKYGKTTIMDTHPNVKGDIYTTTQRKTFRNPGQRTKPNWRARVKNQDFAPTNRSRSQGVYCALASGYVMNSTLFDGTGWEPTQLEPHKGVNQFMGTEYRNRYNPEKKFHKAEVPKSSGKLPKRKTLVYDHY